jgi:hypothetical protein
MKAKKRTGKAKPSGKRGQRDLTARKTAGVKGGESDLVEGFRQKITDSNNIFTPAPPPPPPPPPPRTIRIR